MFKVTFPYQPDKKYSQKVAYFSMEFAIDQALKTYAGGLGFQSGSHMKGAYQKHQNTIGIGILWGYGYYDQIRKSNNDMDVLYQEKYYNFLEDVGIMVPVYINKHQTYVKAMYLPPEVFGTVPCSF